MSPLPLRATLAVLDDGAVRVWTRTSAAREQLGAGGNLLEMLVGATELSAEAVSFGTIEALGRARRVLRRRVNLWPW